MSARAKSASTLASSRSRRAGFLAAREAPLTSLFHRLAGTAPTRPSPPPGEPAGLPTAEPPGPLPGPPATGLVLLTFDAVRRDAVGAYGYSRRPTTPNLDRLAARALRFDRAYATSSRSLRSIPSLLAGVYPSQLGWGDERLFQAVLPGTPNVAALLAGAGWRTAAFSNTDYFAQSPGFYAGFAHTGLGRRFMDSAEDAVNGALAWLEAVPEGEPFFLWVHLFDAHAPYRGHTETTAFGDGERARYDQEVAYVDRLGGRLLDAVAAGPRAADTAVLVTADHGEAFGEHGRHTHGQDLHDEVLRVPLVLAGPGIAPGVRADPVSLADVAPTLLHLAGRPPQPQAGRSLLAPVRPRTLFAEVLPDGEFPNDLKAILRDPYKLVLDVRSGAVALFDLDADPGERANLADDLPDVTRLLESALAGWIEAATLRNNRREARIEGALTRALPHPGEPTPGVVFGDRVELLGYDLPARAVAQGGHLPLTLWFRCMRPVGADWTVRLRFSPLAGLPRLFNGDHTPVAGSYPTSDWKPGQVIRDSLRINVFDIVPPGTRRLSLSLSDGDSEVPMLGERGGGLDLGEVAVLPRDAPPTATSAADGPPASPPAAPGAATAPPPAAPAPLPAPPGPPPGP